MLNTFIHNPINILHTGACNSVYNTQKYTIKYWIKIDTQKWTNI